MRLRQLGVTLIEPIVATAVMGTLLASALPNFVDLRSDTEAAALKSLTATAASAMYVNFAACTVNHHLAAPGKCVAVSNCDQLGRLMEGSDLPGGYAVMPRPLGAGAGDNGNEATCTITQTESGASADFQGIASGL